MMFDDMSLLFTKMIGTLAVILVVSAFIGGSDVISRITKDGRKWKYSVVAGLLGGFAAAGAGYSTGIYPALT